MEDQYIDLISIIVFFVLLGVLFWYWKINQIVSLLEENRDLLKLSVAGEKEEPTPKLFEIE